MSPNGRTMLVLGALLLAALPFARVAHAEFKTSALVKWTSDYTYHGYSKSDHDPSVQMHAAASHPSGVYAGGWLSTVDFGGARFEIAPYLGLHQRLGAALSCDLAVAAYLYDDRVFGHDGSYGEGYARCDWRQALNLRVGLAPDAYGRGDALPTYELGGRYPLSDVLELVAGIGYAQARDIFDYDVVYWNIGMTYFFGAHLALDLRYVDSRYVNDAPVRGSDSPFHEMQADDQVTVGISVGF